MSNKPLIEIKERLNQLLLERNGHIFIIIDDVDRLDQDAMALLFRMIRLNADFKNTTYLLAFDKDVVIDVLEREQPKHGKDYLDKIIQLVVDIPQPDQAMLLEILNTGLTEYLNTYQDYKHWEELLVNGHFRQFFPNIRSIVRFLNSLRVTYPFVAKEVDMVDFMGLEAIRVFAPLSYDLIRSNKEIFTRLASSGIGVSDIPGLTEDIEETRKTIGKIFNPNPILNNLQQETPESQRLGKLIGDICRVLFPQLSRIYSNFHYDQSYERIWRQGKRICSKEMFDKYFMFGIPIGEISSEEMSIVLARSANRELFLEAINELFNRGLGKKFLYRLADHIENIRSENAEEVIITLFNIGDRIASEPRSFMEMGADLLASQITYQLLKQLETTKRKETLLTTIRESRSVFLPIFFVSLLSPDEAGKVHEAKALSGLSFSQSDVKELQNICVELVKKAISENKLSKTPNLGFVFNCWFLWGNEAEVNEYVQNLIKSEEGLIDLLVGMSGEVISSEVGHYRRIRKRDIEKFIDTSSMEPRVSIIKQNMWNDLSTLQQEVVDAFLNPRPDLFDQS